MYLLVNLLIKLSILQCA